MSVSQSSSLMRLHSAHDFQPYLGNLCAPPLHFRRRPPQSNYPPDAVPAPDHGSGLEAQNTKGGIPRLAPRGLASPLHSLPPILDNESQTPTSSCSKGSRGLSVQPRVFGIFTETTISPDPSSRQRPSRYSIRAGRNLPDKEFRSSLTRVEPRADCTPCHAIPACRHADGTISSSSVLDVWRMVSEDSDELAPGLLPVHRLRDPRDPHQPVDGEVRSRLHELEAANELLEVLLLRPDERMLLEEWNDPLQQIAAPPHDVAEQGVTMVVVPPVRNHGADAEETMELLEA